MYFSFFHFIIDKKQLDIEMAHLVAASVEVKGDVAEEGNRNENDGNLKRKRKVNRKYLDDCYDCYDEMNLKRQSKTRTRWELMLAC